ncbi:hypothetical protein TDB9533_03723 [Thalassocella blandensis]|nr:hypothetical protein TDB9533_03723 [Thalassocella blandensis]
MLNVKKRYTERLLLCAAFTLLSACANEKAQPAKPFYALDDFQSVRKIDAHVHANSKDSAMVDQAIADNFTLLTINVDYPDFPPILEQKASALALIDEYPQSIYFASTFSMNGWGEPKWSDKVIQKIQREHEQGALAVKVWKNIGMSYRNQNDALVMIDDSGFDPIFQYLTSQEIPLIGHQGEPHNCWLPIEEMSVNNDKQYFAAHPNYHMYLHPEMPSYQEQMQARNQMLEKNPDMAFVGAHLASLEWSTDALTEFLEKFPTATVDLAARMGQVQAQSQQNYEKVRDFFIRFQHRIIYATDITQAPDSDPAQFKAQAHQKWLEDWQYLVTDDLMEVPEVDGSFKGLKLPAGVIDNIFRNNAHRVFRIPLG